MSESAIPSPAEAGHHATPHPETLAAVLARRTGLSAARCYQCGKCTAGCPMAAEMPIPVHRILRLVQLDERQRVLTDPSIWMCLTCETCTARCPNEVDPAALIDGLRALSLAEYPGAGPRAITAFNSAFINEVARHGRMFELGLIGAYKMRTGKLFDDVLLGPATMMRGKLGFVPHSIKGAADVRRIVDACRKAKEE